MQVNIVVCSKIVSLVMLEQLALSMFCVADSRKPFPLELSRHSQPVNVHATSPPQHLWIMFWVTGLRLAALIVVASLALSTLYFRVSGAWAAVYFCRHRELPAALSGFDQELQSL